jgi:class 3 adenylate cyclase/tetratricopeptide (TPR) repeat protein
MVRKTVTLVFCDVAESTALGERLDPEALRDVWSRYHETARNVLERHGGTIEKFVGDAVMAAFGIPVVHEDDAVRAVRAAVELREELLDLNVELEHIYGVPIMVRTGVNTGEVIAGDPAHGQAFATGDPVVVAQRLEAAAAAGEILVGDSTYRLVRDAVTVAPLPPLELKGKAEAVVAWRLLDVEPDVAGLLRRMDSPLVDRTAELTRLGLEFGRAKGERTCRVVTILGEPGVGKSRLAAELVGSLGSEALVLGGRCLPYGNGITYWPLVEIVRRLDVAAVLDGEADREVVHGRILEAVGRAEARSRSDELYWAVRRLLETLARERPVVIGLDDIQWAEPTFLDLVEYLAGWSRDAAIFICCLARTEFAELRPGWTMLPLGPLTPEDTGRLLENLAGPLEPATTHELGRATGGNPLFLEEMVRMLAEEELLVEREGRVVADLGSLRVPPTIQAVLAARLDRLSEGERDVLQRASVIGEVFWWGAVAELTPPEGVDAVPGRLQALARKGLIRPDRQTLAGEDGFRFAHILVRDAAYESMTKRRRGELHERFADWLASRVPDTSEYDEILGHHLEQALAYRLELGPSGAAEAALAERAAERLAPAGSRALARDDAHAAVNLLGRASALRAGDPALLLEHADARAGLGDIRAAEETYQAALAAAVLAGDRRSETCARLELGLIGLLTRAEARVSDLADEVERALPVFQQAGDDATLARLLTRLADAFWWRCRIVAMQDALERALLHARRAGDERQIANVAVRLGFAAIIGPTPVAEGRRFLGDALEQSADDTSSKGMLLLTSALLAALDADFHGARELAGRGTAMLDALGRSVGLAAISTWTAAIDLLAGDAVSAERDLRPALEQLDRAGQRANAASVAAQLAEAVARLGRHEEAASLTEASEAAAPPDDLHAQIAWRVARAKVCTALGDGGSAEAVAREAVALAYETDSPLYTADALEALAITLEAAGRQAEAEAAARDALRLHESKGNRVGVDRVRSRAAAARTAWTGA